MYFGYNILRIFTRKYTFERGEQHRKPTGIVSLVQGDSLAGDCQIMMHENEKPSKKSKTKRFALAVLFTGCLFLFGCSLDEPVVPEPLESPGSETPIPIAPLETQENSITYLDPSSEMSGEKYMFRAAWLPSVLNLGYPETQGMTAAELKTSFLKILDVYEFYNLNAVIMQVRPSGDALYLSALNPVSPYVTGKVNGSLPFDLLFFAIDETHKRGMEFHAWFNPYRVTVAKEPLKSTEEILDTLSSKNYARLHPEKVLRFDDKLFLNPGDPDTMAFVTQSILEVVSQYDIDAVHLDDYFYPYRSSRMDETGARVPYHFGDDKEDEATFLAHKGSYTDIREWRRNNTYTFVRNLSEAIKDLKPYVKLGVSPFGIWGHADETQGLGSDTPMTSSETYVHAVFADTRKWVKDEIIDYIIPQIYWNFDEASAPYGELATWWSEVVEGTNVSLYIGLANYKVFEAANNPSWQGDTLIKEQLEFNKTLPMIKGASFFSFRYLTPSNKAFSENVPAKESLLKNNAAIQEEFRYPAVIPYNNHFDKVSVSLPSEIRIENNVLTFKDGYGEFDEVKKTRYFLIYQFPRDDIDPDNPSYIYKKVVYDEEMSRYTVNHLDTDTFVYGVSAFNRLNEESRISVIDMEP